MFNDPTSSPVLLNESYWGKVDDASQPQDYAAYLEFVESSNVAKLLRGTLFDLLPLSADSRVLDAGCGLGAHARALAERIGPDGFVWGIDKSRVMIERARALPAATGSAELIFETGDICELPYGDESFDAVLTDRVMIHVSQPERALAEFFRVLKPGGHLVMSETDWSVFAITPASKATRLLVEEKIGSFTNPSFGADMTDYMKETGFKVLQHKNIFHGNREYDFTWRMMNLEGAGRRLVEKGQISDADFESLKESLEDAEQAGELIINGAMYFGLAQKERKL